MWGDILINYDHIVKYIEAVMLERILVVADVQNDGCHQDGVFPNLYSYLPRVGRTVDNIEKVVDYWRNSDWPVIHTQYIWEGLSKGKQDHFSKRFPEGFYREGKWGSDFYKIVPEEGEPVFKKGSYSLFECPEFQEYARRIEHGSPLVLVGFFSDVCIGATAQDAWELDIPTEIIADCSTNKTEWRSHEGQLRYMERFYGTRIHQNLDALLGEM